MGNIIPINSDKKQRIEDLAEAILKTFATEYAMAYGICFLKKTMEDVGKGSSPEAKLAELYQLTHRPWDSIKKPIQFGTLTKQGAFRKNWKKRFFVVNYNYIVDYFENEEAYQKGFRPKGTIYPGGYSVVTDANEGLIEKLKKVAKVLGVSEDEIPEPGEKFPEFTFELAHDRRRPYFISASSQEEKDSWIAIFKDCCYHARGLRNEDEVGREAFKVAFRRTQYEHGSCWWSFRGTEEQMLCEFIVRKLDLEVMYEVYSSISGNWTIRNKIREQVCKTLDSLVMAMVTPTWSTAMEASVQAKGTMESLIKDKKDEVSAVERKVTWELTEKLSGAVKTTLSELQLEEKLKEMADNLKPRTQEALEKAKEILTEKLDEVIQKAKNCSEKVDSVLESYWDILDKLPRTYRLMRPVYNIMDKIYWEFPDKFQEVFNFYRSDVVNIGKQIVNETVDAGVCTFEESFKKLTEEGEASLKELTGAQAAEVMEKVKQDVLKKYDADVSTTVNAFCISGCREIMQRKVREMLDIPCKPLVTTVDKAIPDTLRKIMSVEDKYEQFVDNTLFEVVRKVLGVEVPEDADKKLDPDNTH